MRNLKDLAVNTFVGIHDCWLVPEHQIDLLDKAMRRAASEWYKGLGSIFQDLAPYARYSKRLKNFLRDARRRWRRRLKSGRLPEFRAKAVLG
jgi:hypothetical protein